MMGLLALVKWWRVAAVLAIAMALIAGAWKLHHSIDAAGYQRAQDEYAAAAAKQTDTNRTTARAAEVRYVDREVVRTEFITVTQKELAHEATNLAACSLDAGDIRLLHAAAQCARQDRPAACGAGNPVPPPQ